LDLKELLLLYPFFSLFASQYVRNCLTFLPYNFRFWYGLLLTVEIIFIPLALWAIYWLFKNYISGSLDDSMKTAIKFSLISLLFSFLFITGVGNLFNRLYKRGFVQIGIGLTCLVIYVELLYPLFGVNYFHFDQAYFYCLLFVEYWVYVTWDTYKCSLARSNGESIPLFMGIDIS